MIHFSVSDLAWFNRASKTMQISQEFFFFAFAFANQNRIERAILQSMNRVCVALLLRHYNYADSEFMRNPLISSRFTHNFMRTNSFFFREKGPKTY